MRTYVDVGTHRITNQLLRKIDCHDFCILIEPIPKRFEELKVLESSNIIVLNQVVSNFDGTASFKIANRDSCSSLQSFTSEAVSDCIIDKFGHEFQMVSEIDVKVSKLSTLLKQFEINHVDFLHIDAQGEDLNVVKSLDDLIAKVKLIQLESMAEGRNPLYVDQPFYFEVMKYMKDIGFKEFTRTHFPEHRREIDVIFTQWEISLL